MLINGQEKKHQKYLGESNIKTTAIILASGKGTRMKADMNKVFIKLKKPILCHTLDAFEKNEQIDEIFLVTNKDEIGTCQEIITNHHFKKVKEIIPGGDTRQESCRNGVMRSEDSEIILIHDGARPFVTQDTITRCIDNAKEHGVSVVGVPAKDTIKLCTDNEFVKETLDRNKLWVIQTPQVFKSAIIKLAHKKAKEDDFLGTDDVSLAERLGYDVKLTLGHYDNIKITTPDDLAVAEKILEKNGYGDDCKND